MIAADTSSVLAYLAGASGEDVERMYAGLAQGSLVLPCVVLTELFSAPSLPKELENLLRHVPAISPVGPDFWRRAGQNRTAVLASGRKARLADTLIATLCMDHQAPLLTRDKDFRHFAGLGFMLI